MNKNRWIIPLTLATTLFGMVLSATANPVHRKGCEFPLSGVEVCWEATASLGSSYAPYDELHILPIARKIAGNEEILESYSRDVFKQLMPGNLAEYLVPEWVPAFTLEQAMAMSREEKRPSVMWISPRVLKNSSAAGPGVVDWDVYILSRGQLVRTMRIRVASAPKEHDDAVEKGLTMGTVMAATGSFLSGGFLGAVAATTVEVGTANRKPPEAGKALELMTELATRQLMFLAQYPIEALNYPGAPMPPKDTTQPPERINNWLRDAFAAK
ncbi:MAG: hypothetical protein HQL79_01550 [Magnetococcales bacterium]|nr:hypothetical protein [Magnetococcales bacterium]